MQDLSGAKDEWGECADCGTSPIGHTTAWINNSMDVLTATKHIRTKPRLRDQLLRFLMPLVALLGGVILMLLRALYIVRFNDDIEKACTLRSRVIWEEARERGIPMQQILFAGIPTELFRAEIKGQYHVFHSLPIPDRMENDASWVDDKILFKKRMTEEGIPVPESISASTIEQALEAQKKIGGPVCIKPRSSSRARHTSTYVVTAEEVKDAFQRAKQLCYWVSVEKNLDGEVCRATCIDGRLVGFLQSVSPAVVGDGESSVGQLIEKANKEKPERVHDIEMSSVHLRAIKRRGYTLDSVLEKDKRLPLTHWRGRLFGGRTREMPNIVHPELRIILEKAAKVTKQPTVGFDLIIPDPEKNPEKQEWGIIEANTLPYIDLHYWPLEGRPTNVAAAVWDLWRN